METETKTRPKRNGRLSLYPMKLEDALRTIAKVKPEKKQTRSVRSKHT